MRELDIYLRMKKIITRSNVVLFAAMLVMAAIVFIFFIPTSQDTLYNFAYSEFLRATKILKTSPNDYGRVKLNLIDTANDKQTMFCWTPMHSNINMICVYHNQNNSEFTTFERVNGVFRTINKKH